MLNDRHVVLGVTGSIAAYKAADLASKLVQAGAQVEVVMTEAATRFVTPLTFQGLTRRRVIVDMFDPDLPAEEHVELARRADIVVIAPAAAETIARLAYGLAGDMVSLTALATTAPVLVAPAMDSQMYENAATQANLELLRQRGVTIVGPGIGRLASGRTGPGRLADSDEIIGAVHVVLGRDGDLAGRRVVVTAGGTQEPIDPVRYVGNHSSGKMGYAIAEAARDRGAAVTLISAPSSLAAPYGVRLVKVQRAVEMLAAVDEEIPTADVLIMAGAVADFQPSGMAEHKIKKREGGPGLVLELERVPDAWPRWAELGPDCIRVGFAAESRDLLAYAQDKLARSRMDLIAANDITAPDAGFAVDTNRVTILDRQGGVQELPLMSKYEVAHRLLDRVVELLQTRRPAVAGR